MPDISMCWHSDCPLRHTCYRHEDSGTEPTQFRQSYGPFAPDEDGNCDHYWPTTKESSDEA